MSGSPSDFLLWRPKGRYTRLRPQLPGTDAGFALPTLRNQLSSTSVVPLPLRDPRSDRRATPRRDVWGGASGLKIGLAPRVTAWVIIRS